jgi:serine/threonine protein kinase
MEYVDGPTFSEVRLTQPHQVFDSPELLGYVEALCDALHYAHTRRKIVHRDLKPRNLMLNSEGELKIADFGISRSISESMIMVTGKLGSTGSPPYISPQQWDGDPPTPLDDIYSAGATLYELLSGKPPLLGQVDWHQVHSKIPPPIWKRRLEFGITGVPPVPAAWEETIAACLAKNPQDRPQTIRELHERLASNGATVVSTAEPATAIPVDLVPEPPEAPVDVDDSFLNEMTLQDVSGDTAVIDKTLSEPKLEVPGTPASITNLTPPAPEALPTGVSETPLAEQEPEPPPIPSIAQEPAASPAEPIASIEPVALAPVISEPKMEGPAAPLVDTNVAEPPAVLTDRRDELIVPPLSPQELEELPTPDAEPSHIERVPEQPASPLAQQASSALAPTPAEQITATLPWPPIAETEETDRSDTTSGSPRRIPRWLWLTGAAATLLVLGIPFLWKKPVGPARAPSNLGSSHSGTNPSSTPRTPSAALPLPTPYIRTEVTQPQETANVPPAANSSAAVIAEKDAPPLPNQPSISGAQKAPPDSSAVVIAPQEVPSIADHSAVGSAPIRPDPPTAASAAKDASPAANPSPAVIAAEAAPPSAIPSATVAAAETVSPPAHATLATSPEARPKKRETVTKRTERKSTGESQSTRSNAAAARPAASPAPTKKPARKGPASQPFDGGVPGG